MISPLRAIRAEFEPMRSMAFGDIGANYSIIGTLFQNPIRILTIQNLTDADLLFSRDGVNDWVYVQAGSSILIDFCSNRTDMGGALVISANTGIWVKESGTPTMGNVYVSADYGQD